jgi:DNA adenine methylase
MSTSLFDDFVRPTQPAAGYIGGKRRLAGRICRAIDRIPHRSYCEVFMGMGGIFLRRSRIPHVEVINDFSEDVATFFRVLQRHYVAFLDMLRFQVTTRSGFEKLAALDPASLTDLERSARFLYLQRLAYGGKVTSRSFGVDPHSPAGFDMTKIPPLLEALHERLARVTIERLSWDELIPRYDLPDALFYLDPPYYGSEGDYGRGLFDRSHFARMAALLESIKGRFLLSQPDHPEVRRIFAPFAMAAVDVKYSIGGGERTVDAVELVISNLDQAELDRVMAGPLAEE